MSHDDISSFHYDAAFHDLVDELAIPLADNFEQRSFIHVTSKVGNQKRDAKDHASALVEFQLLTSADRFTLIVTAPFWSCFCYPDCDETKAIMKTTHQRYSMKQAEKKKRYST
uniref:hypothetical protein n=1 Tax=Halomonas sp. TaxID=1486246 RepID=UPI0026050C99|nr:hypothetical protein [Halomonas sp.]